MKLLTDENFSSVVVRKLREDKHDILDIKESKFHRLSDTAILKLATKEHRVIVTHDTDYLDLSRIHPHPTSSIIILPSNQRHQLMFTRIRMVLGYKKLFHKNKPYVVIIEHDKLQINAV